jgi:hypothetical protein
MEKKVSVEVGSYGQFIFKKPVARVVSLAGMQMKYEVCEQFVGKISDISHVTNEEEKLTSEGKTNYKITITNEQGSRIETTRENMKECVLVS